jgi:hypothetical protein
MVKDPTDYVCSSYRCNAFGRSTKLWEPHEEYLSLASGEIERQARYRALFNRQIGAEVLADLRQSINQGLAFVSGVFRVEIEKLGGRRQNLLKRGPRPKEGGQEFLL